MGILMGLENENEEEIEKKNTTVTKESCIKNIKRAHRENRIMFCPILSQ